MKQIVAPIKTDLHCHTMCSDGALAPEELVEYAAEPRRAVRVLAVTDHDNMNGVARAEKRGGELDVRVVPGIEISTTWQFGSCRFQIHVVGLRCDRNDPVLGEIIRYHGEIREQQCERIAKRLTELLDFDAELLYAKIAELEKRGTFVTRKHFSDFLVEQKLVSCNDEAFSRYLGKNGSAFFDVDFSSVEEAVAAIHHSGGLAVLAHPFRYENMHNRALRNLAAFFHDCGGDGIEAGSPQQKLNEKLFIRDLALKHGFFGSVGSDFHCKYVPFRTLGGDLWLPEKVKPIWEHELLLPYYKT